MSESQSTSSHTRKSDESKNDKSKSGNGKKDKSKSDENEKNTGLLARVTVRSDRKYKKRRANWERDIAEKKRKGNDPRLPDDSTVDDLSGRSSSRYPRRKQQASRARSRRSFRKPPTDSEIRPPQDYDELMLIHPELNTNTPISSSDLTSFRNLAGHFQRIAAYLRQYQPKSMENSNGSCIKKSSFEPSYVFRDLLYTANNKKAEKKLRKWKILQPNFPIDDSSEDQRILGDIRKVFEKEKKLNDSPSQTETVNVQQTVDKDVQNPSDQDNQDCYDWDKFLDRWDGMHITSESTLEAQQQKHKTIKKPEACLPAKRTIKRKQGAEYSSQVHPFIGQARKRPCIAGSYKMPASTSFKSTPPDKEHISNPKFVLPSIEMEMIVHPVSLDVSETSTASKLETLIKNTKIKLLANDEMPPFQKELISKLESLPHRTDGYCMSINPTHAGENITDDTNNSIDKTEELSGVERDDGDDTEMVSGE